VVCTFKELSRIWVAGYGENEEMALQDALKTALKVEKK
jgi:hypothetical protein